MELKSKKEISWSVLQYHFSDRIKREKIYNKFLFAKSKSGSLAFDLKVLKTILREDAVNLFTGDISEYQLSKVPFILESYSKRISHARQKLAVMKRKKLAGRNRELKSIKVPVLLTVHKDGSEPGPFDKTGRTRALRGGGNGFLL
ncbi:MAG: hypothetical protein PHE84_10385 [bacterium]|nr:hypothetical protein [bacterium]